MQTCAKKNLHLNAATGEVLTCLPSRRMYFKLIHKHSCTLFTTDTHAASNWNTQRRGLEALQYPSLFTALAL